MPASLTRAAEVKMPAAGDIRVIPVTTTPTLVDFQEFKRSWISFHAQLADMYIVFGDSSVVADNAATSGNTRAIRIPVDQERAFWFGNDRAVTHFSVETSAGAGTLRYYKD